jgi:hypothetical protein
MRNLDEWEIYLRSYFQRRLRLIGEIPLRRRDVEEIADLISTRFAETSQREGMARGTDDLKNNYPYVFTTFLTAFATFNEERNYWTTLAERLNVPKSHIDNYRWRHIAYEFIQSKRLPILSVDQASNKYVSTLYFHGGIPLYSLADFFSRILLPSVEKPDYVDLSSTHALELLLDGRINNVDSAVVNFLTYSGEFGEAFFASCRDMAWRYIKKQEVVTPDEVDLPPYLVESFIKFMESNQEQAFHLRKPFLLFNPYDEPCLRLVLPEEQLPLYLAEDNVFWQITWDGQNFPIEVSPTLRKQRQDVLIRESRLPIHDSPATIKISLNNRGKSGSPQPIRSWTLPCFPTINQPLLVVRANGHVIPSVQELPGEVLLLVFPNDFQVRTEGDATKLENYTYLSGEFSNWKAEAWDLRNSHSLHLWKSDEEICPSIPIGFADQSPILAGVKCQFADDPQGIPLYAGHFPILRIPRRPGRSLEDELKRWKVEIRSHWETDPIMDLETTPAAFLDYVHESDTNFVDFDLSAILDKNTMGTFNLRVKSQYETEAEFRFRIWPSLYVLGLEKYYFPTNGSAEPISFNLRLPDETFCEIQPGAEGISIEQSALVTKITAEASCSRVDLYLVKRLIDQSQELLRVPISIPLSRPQWKVLTGDFRTEPDWESRPIQKPFDSMLQAHSASIHLSMRGIHDIADRISLLLIDPGQPGEYIQEEKLRSNSIDTDILRIPLSPFRTTLAGYAQSPQLELHLFYRAPNFEESIRIPLVFLSRQLEIREVSIKQIGDLTWHLTWNETHPLRNRRVLISPVWQPWITPWEFQIPDKARGNFIINNIGLLPSHYRIAFYTAPPPELPRTDFQGVDLFDVYTCDATDRIQELTSQPCPTPEQEFRRQFELCCILAEIGRPYDSHLNKCVEILKLRKISNLDLLLSCYFWLEEQSTLAPENTGLKSNLLAFLSWTYTPEIINQMLRREKRNSQRRMAYLNLVKTSRNMFPESARLLIQHEDDPSIVLFCLKVLIENNTDESVSIILDLIRSARLSNRDAAYILAPHWNTALDSLIRLPETNIRNSLIQTLLHRADDPIVAIKKLPAEMTQLLLSMDSNLEFHKYYSQVLAEQAADNDSNTQLQNAVPQPMKLGLESGSQDASLPTSFNRITISSRLLTPAGIGEVISIRRNGDKELSNANIKEKGLSVVLKLVHGEIVTLDLEKNAIKFSHENRIYACSNCNHYASSDKSILIDHQQETHPFMKHSMREFLSEFSIDRRDILVLPPK